MPLKPQPLNDTAAAKVTKASLSPALESFATQAKACRKGGSPFSADILDCLAEDYRDGGPAANIASDWDSDAFKDAMPLRLIGALHRIALDGIDDRLARHYPSAGGEPDTATLREDIVAALGHHRTLIDDYMTRPPQTNEVGRSGALLGGFLTLAEETRLPLRLKEIGASAGLNLFWDRFRYTTETFNWKMTDSEVWLEPSWTGPPPPLMAPIAIEDRAACDISPVDIFDEAACRTIESYIWSDQSERLTRLRGAITIARHSLYRLEKADAATWLASELANLQPGLCTVVFHSVFWQYMTEEQQTATIAVIRKAGSQANARAPFAWLRLEPEDLKSFPRVILTVWPGEHERVLGSAHFHGTWVNWGNRTETESWGTSS